MENDTLEHQTNGIENDCERIVGNAIQNQVIGMNIEDKIRKVVDTTVKTAKNRMPDLILTAIDEMVISLNEMALRLITGSSGHSPNSVVQNPNWRDLAGNTENNPLMSASSRLDLNVDQNRIEESPSVENFKDGGFPALKHDFDWRTHTHHGDRT